MEFQHVAAIVTGGASGLGEGAARALAAAGCKVAILDVQQALGERVATEIGGMFVHGDAGQPDWYVQYSAPGGGGYGPA